MIYISYKAVRNNQAITTHLFLADMYVPLTYCFHIVPLWILYYFMNTVQATVSDGLYDLFSDIKNLHSCVVFFITFSFYSNTDTRFKRYSDSKYMYIKKMMENRNTILIKHCKEQMNILTIMYLYILVHVWLKYLYKCTYMLQLRKRCDVFYMHANIHCNMLTTPAHWNFSYLTAYVSILIARIWIMIN